MKTKGEELKSRYATVAMSKEHKKRLTRYCKQQRQSHVAVIEYLIDFGIFHDLDSRIPIPKSRLLKPVTKADFNDLKTHLENLAIKLSRENKAPDSGSVELIKKLNSRYLEMVEEKEEEFNQVVKQWNESLLQNKELKRKLSEQTGNISG